jgi:Cft2 family RNA processing exonuclease
MQLTFLGGANEVGASATLVEVAGLRLLVDAGIRISNRADRTITSDQLPDLQRINEAGGIDAILVTHAHTDHTGALPLVAERYPGVPVLATPPSIELIKVLQADAQKIMASRQESEGELPLFDEIALSRLLDAFQPVFFRQPIYLDHGVEVTYYPSGHILGAGSLVIESDEGTLVMSGDVSMTPQRTVQSADLPNIKAHALVLESTYGGRLHANRIAEENRLVARLQEITAAGGRVLIPAFALGRAQEILQIILARAPELNVPIYVDGMVRLVCKAYSHFDELIPRATTQLANGDDLFFRGQIQAVTGAAQRQEIARMSDPAIVVASSGMLTGGASAFYAYHFAGDAQNLICTSGYTDEESPGRFLQRMMRERQAGEGVPFRLGKETVSLRSQIDAYSLSAHADEAELISMAEAFDPDHIMLVHGDGGARGSLRDRLQDRQKRVTLPVAGQTVALAMQRTGRLYAMQRGEETGAIDVESLWTRLRGTGGNAFTPAQLSIAWYGDSRRQKEISAVLNPENPYFTRDVNRPNYFRVSTIEEVAMAGQRAILLEEFPDLIGQLAVFRTRKGLIRAGVIIGLSSTIEAVTFGTEARRFPFEDLIWPVGAWEGSSDPKQIAVSLSPVIRDAWLVRSTLLSIIRRDDVVEGKIPVRPEALLPETLPAGVSRQVALLGIVMLLGEDGGVRTPEGILTEIVNLDPEPMEQNHVRQTLLETLGDLPAPRKIAMDSEAKRMTLLFDFPAAIKAQVAKAIRKLPEITGWTFEISEAPNQHAVRSLILELLPADVKIIQGPIVTETEARILFDGSLPDTLKETFAERSGLKLVIGR